MGKDEILQQVQIKKKRDEEKRRKAEKEWQEKQTEKIEFAVPSVERHRNRFAS